MGKVMVQSNGWLELGKAQTEHRTELIKQKVFLKVAERGPVHCCQPQARRGLLKWVDLRGFYRLSFEAAD